MFTSLTVENFKCFRERTEIPLAPLTLIYGPNSSGKSTILQPLYLLKQNVPSIDASGVLPLVLGGHRAVVDLGTYYDLVHDHDVEKSLLIGFQWKHDWVRPDHFRATGDELDYAEWLKAELEYKYNKPLGGPVLSAARFEPDKYGEVKVSPFPSWPGKYIYDIPVRDHLPHFEFVKRNRSTIAHSVELDIDVMALNIVDPTGEHFWDRKERSVKEYHKDPRFLQERAKHSARWQEELQFLARDFSLEEYSRRPWARRVQATNDFQGFFPTDDQEMPLTSYETAILEQWIEYQRGKGWMMGRPLTPKEYGMPTLFSDPVLPIVRSILLDAIQKILPVGPMRLRPSKGSQHLVWADDLGFAGEGLIRELVLANQTAPDSPKHDFNRTSYRSDRDCDPHALASVNEWLGRLTGYTCEVRDPPTDLPEEYRIGLIDRQRSTPRLVSLENVGFGISQLFPMIVRACISRNSTITIEQPEIHIHPKLQAELGEMFNWSRKNRGNQFIMETHSEHLILRVQRLMRRGELKPDQVRVLYVSRHEDGSNVQELRLDEKGQFLDPWPDGFFPERVEEIFGD